jgi:hypothetical protein
MHYALTHSHAHICVHMHANARTRTHTPYLFLIIFKQQTVNVEFTHQQMHFFILKNTLKFTLKYT